MSRAARISALALAALISACGILEPVAGQPPTPTPAELMTLEVAVEQLGLTPEDVVQLDAQTAAVVRGVPDGVELLLFQRFAGGPWNGVGAASGDWRTAGDGRAGSVPFGEPSWEQLVFGIGPSGVERVELIGADGETMMVNPDAGTWLIALREQEPIDRLQWRLIGPDGEVLFDGSDGAPTD